MTLEEVKSKIEGILRQETTLKMREDMLAKNKGSLSYGDGQIGWPGVPQQAMETCLTIIRAEHDKEAKKVAAARAEIETKF